MGFDVTGPAPIVDGIMTAKMHMTTRYTPTAKDQAQSQFSTRHWRNDRNTHNDNGNSHRHLCRHTAAGASSKLPTRRSMRF